MNTYSAHTTLRGRSAAESLAQALERLAPTPIGTSFVELDGSTDIWEVGAYFSGPPDTVGLALLSAAHSAKEFAVSELPAIDWVSRARRELHPVRAGRYWIFGGHACESPPPGLVPLRIRSTMAFGTGHHATTQGCLVALDAIVSEGAELGNVGDIGCGTSVLAIAAAKSGAVQVAASDVDPMAIEVARENLAANELAARVVCFQADGFDHPLHRRRMPYGLVFANILKAPLIQLAGSMCESVRPGGFAVLSGILCDQAGEVEDAYASSGFSVSNRHEIGEWTTLTMVQGSRG